jgi:hypothetical protein
MKSCSASSVDPGEIKGSAATFSMFPMQGAAAAKRSSAVQSSMVIVRPLECPVDPRRLTSTIGSEAR